MKKNFTYDPAFISNILVNARKENFCTWGSKYTLFDPVILVYIVPFYS
jgi:hypothetical protein